MHRRPTISYFSKTNPICCWHLWQLLLLFKLFKLNRGCSVICNCPQRIHHSPTSQKGITPHRMGVSLAHGGQHIISQDYQINHSTHPFWYSRNWNGYDNDYCDVCAIWDPISDDNLSSRDPFHANQTNPKKNYMFSTFSVLKVQSF